MIKRVVVILITILSFGLSAQQTVSPYSFYGLGSLNLRGTVENKSMGGISVYMDSIHMNLRNPASYVSKNVDAEPFAGESRPVKYAVGGSYSAVSLTDGDGSVSVDRGSFDYFAFNFPIGRLGLAGGTTPYSSVGYRLQGFNNDGDIQSRFEGDGGVDKVFAGLAYKFSDNFSVGLDINYSFGFIENTALRYLYSNGQPVQFQTLETNRSDLRGVGYNFGASYRTKINNKFEVIASASYAPETNLRSDNQRTLASVSVNTLSEVEVVTNIIEVDLAEQDLEVTDLALPSRLAIGAGIGQPRHWFVGAEYTTLSNSQFNNPIFDIDISEFENSHGFAVGGFIIPRYNAFRGYFKRVVYRAGFRTENTGLVLNGESIREFGISFGMSLPLLPSQNGSNFSDVNIGFEYGQRGTTNNNLVREDFFSFNIGLSLNDRWFKRSKYK